MRIRHIFWCTLIGLVGCAGQVDTVDEERLIQTFYIKKITVNLAETTEGKVGRKEYPSKNMLAKDFAYSIHKHLMTEGIYASTPGGNVGELVIAIDYLRRCKVGGRALNRPLISHQVIIFQGTQEVTQLIKKDYTPQYDYFKSVYVNVERAIHQWDKEDEHVDVDNISEDLVESLKDAFHL